MRQAAPNDATSVDSHHGAVVCEGTGSSSMGERPAVVRDGWWFDPALPDVLVVVVQWRSESVAPLEISKAQK